jgi:hypothetical protein
VCELAYLHGRWALFRVIMGGSDGVREVNDGKGECQRLWYS